MAYLFELLSTNIPIFSAAPIIGDALMVRTAFYVLPSVRTLYPAKSNCPIATKFGIYNLYIVEM